MHGVAAAWLSNEHARFRYQQVGPMWKKGAEDRKNGQNYRYDV